MRPHFLYPVSEASSRMVGTFPVTASFAASSSSSNGPQQIRMIWLSTSICCALCFACSIALTAASPPGSCCNNVSGCDSLQGDAAPRPCSSRLVNSFNRWAAPTPTATGGTSLAASWLSRANHFSRAIYKKSWLNSKTWGSPWSGHNPLEMKNCSGDGNTWDHSTRNAKGQEFTTTDNRLLCKTICQHVNTSLG